MNLYTYVQNNPLKYIDPSGNRYIHSDMNSILAATMKITSTESRAYSYAYNLLSQEFADVYDNNRFNYLFGLLTQTSVYKNSAGNADWARAELAKDYSKWHQEISFAEALASLGPVIGGIGKAREVGGKGRAIGGCNCFTAGTKVLTDEEEKNIEDIEVGDMVLAKDEETGEQAYKEVTHLYRNEKDTTYKLSVGDQIIETTDNHPFWVDGKGWILVVDLKVGDELVQSNGNHLKIDNIEIVHHDEKVKVYNFTVAHFHTYFVSDLGIWVHNIDCGLRPEAKYLKSGKHGVNWKEGPAMAKKSGLPQGQWSKADLEFAGGKAATLKSGEGGWFDLPSGSTSRVYMPDGSTVNATRIWVRNNGSGTFHGYPAP